MLTTIPPPLHSPSSAVRRPRARPRILSPPPPPPHPCPHAPSVTRRLCAVAVATISRAAPLARQRYAATGVHRAASPWPALPRLCGPCPSIPTAASARLRPQPRQATWGTQFPAPSYPKPFSTGSLAQPLPTKTWGYGTQLPARVAALCRAARRGRLEPRSPLRQPVGVGAWACPNFRSGRARLGSPRRRQFRHGDSAPRDHKGLRLEGCTGKGFDGG